MFLADEVLDFDQCELPFQLSSSIGEDHLCFESIVQVADRLERTGKTQNAKGRGEISLSQKRPSLNSHVDVFRQSAGMKVRR